MIPIWVADMEFAVALPMQEALIARVKGSGYGYEYKPDEYYEAQRDWYLRRQGIELDKEQVLYTSAISATIGIAIEQFTTRGDGVIIQPPVFMEFRSTIRSTGWKVVKNTLKIVDGRYEMNFEDLEEKATQESNRC